MAQVTIKDLLEAGVHFGHQTKRWNPKMKPYIFGARNGINVFDLTITLRQLAKACAFLQDTVATGGEVLFVGTKRQAQELVRENAERVNMPYMCHRWLGGTLTNNRVVLSRLGRMKKLQGMESSGEMATLPKKEVAALRRELTKLERNLGGIVDMRRLPSALVIVDVQREHIAVQEADRLGIPVVAIVDSNCDPDLIDYVVPGNDDAVRAVKTIVDAFTAAVAEGLGGRGKGDDESPTRKAEAPKAEAPKAEAPKAEAPKPEAPKAEAPKAETVAQPPAVQPQAEPAADDAADADAVPEQA
jgi:small subunit ribosomal protein S2